MRRWYLTLTLTLIALGVAALPAAQQKRGCRMDAARWAHIPEVSDMARVPEASDMARVDTARRERPLLLVVDTSGSVPEAPDRAVEVVEALQLSSAWVITYSDHARMLLSGHHPPAQTAEVLRTLPPPRGGSNPVAGLSLALDRCREVGGGRIVWVSDGSMNSGATDPAILESLAAQAVGLGVRIDAVEIGAPKDTMMRYVASQTGGTWIQADQAVAGRL